MKTLLLLLALATSALAQTVPPLVTYQGRLTDASGNPAADGNGYEVEIRLWTTPTGGTAPVWAARYSAVTLKGGAMNLILGSPQGTSIAGAATTDLKAAFAGPQIFLGLTVAKGEGGTPIANPAEILPRQQWMTAPFSFQAEKAATSAFAESIGDGSVTPGKIASRAVTADKIQTGAITADKIANGSIASQKLDPAYIVISEKQPSGTAPQAAVRGWQKRAFNTIESISGDRFSIDDSLDRFTLAPGIYEITAIVPYSSYWGADRNFPWGASHQAALKRISDGQLVGVTPRYSDDEIYNNFLSATHTGTMQISAIVSLAQPESFELMHHIRDIVASTPQGNPGSAASYGSCGKPSSLEDVQEIYSRIVIKALK